MLFLRLMSRANLIGLLPAELGDLAVALGASRYRGRQLATWIYRKGVVDLEAMTDLPRDFKERLSQEHEISLPELERQTPSQVSLSYARNPDLGRCAVGLIHWQRAKLGSLQLQA